LEPLFERPLELGCLFGLGKVADLHPVVLARAAPHSEPPRILGRGQPGATVLIDAEEAGDLERSDPLGEARPPDGAASADQGCEEDPGVVERRLARDGPRFGEEQTLILLATARRLPVPIGDQACQRRDADATADVD
jgi:hypothetical protein